jgi:single-strand DNA-binding protein
VPSRNRVELIGYLGHRPELHHTGTGVPVTTLSVATNEKWRTKDGKEQERTEWHRVVLWHRAAETVEFLQKGSLVSVEGSLRTREWTDGEGARRISTEIHVRPGGLLFLDRRTVAVPSGEDIDHEMPPEPLPELPPTDHADESEIPL